MITEAAQLAYTANHLLKKSICRVPSHSTFRKTCLSGRRKNLSEAEAVRLATPHECFLDWAAA